MTRSMQEHWDAVYASKAVHQLGWFEPEPGPSLQLIERCGIGKDEPILDAGSGATTLIRALLEQGYQDITAVDISETALRKAREALGEQLSAKELALHVTWIADDLTHPTRLLARQEIAVWHDRAVLHFFTAEEQRQQYRATLLRLLRPGGYAILAAFQVGGATQCSGLDVCNYDTASLSAFLGPDFSCLESLDYLYHMPSGDTRPYVYGLFQRSGA